MIFLNFPLYFKNEKSYETIWTRLYYLFQICCERHIEFLDDTLVVRTLNNKNKIAKNPDAKFCTFTVHHQQFYHLVVSFKIDNITGHKSLTYFDILPVLNLSVSNPYSVSRLYTNYTEWSSRDFTQPARVFYLTASCIIQTTIPTVLFSLFSNYLQTLNNDEAKLFLLGFPAL